MLTSDFDYNLPLECIAQIPVEPRDSSRFMIVDHDVHEIKHTHFSDVVNYLQEGDLLVWNNSKVFKARLRGVVLLDDAADGIDEKFVPTGKILNSSPMEIFLVRPMENKFVWKVLAKPGRRLRLGMKVKFADDFEGEVMLKEKDGTILMQFADDDMAVRVKANKYGEVPTPPYVRNEQFAMSNEQVSEQYQTVYAKHEGSVAAPTAGFHFTPELIEKLENKGVQFAEVTLHVGLGTFLPVKVDKIEEHQMHSEQVELTAKNADLVNTAKAEGRRVIAVGTTTVRTLEGIALMSQGRGGFSPPSRTDAGQGRETQPLHPIRLQPYIGDINIFITPGFQFQVIDAMITNFHLPKSTLLMLVSAFVGDREFTLECYQKAIAAGYRFYSFGDAMLIK